MGEPNVLQTLMHSTTLRDALLTSIVDPRRASVGVSEQVLHLIERHVLAK